MTEQDTPRVIMGPVAVEFQGKRYDLTADLEQHLKEYQSIIRTGQEMHRKADQMMQAGAKALATKLKGN